MRKQKPHILYVDDEPNNLTVFRSTFRRVYKVHLANSAQEALELLENTEDEIPLIVTDQRMPEMTGVQFLEKVVEKYPETIRMILTGFSDVEAIIQAINQGGVYRYITKPWDKDELKITFDNALESFRLKKENKSLVLNLKEANEELEEKVERRTAQLAKKNKDIMDSINYAKRIQDSMLPPLSQIKNELTDSFVLFKPRDIVSGDFYWFAKKDGKIIIAAVDCTGHGVPGAFMSMIGNDILNSLVIERGITDAAEILHYLNLGIKGALKQDKTQNRDGMDLALCVIEPEKQFIEFAGAKNPLIYIQNGEIKKIKGSLYSIGGGREGVKSTFEKHAINVEKGTVCYIFSDGYQDQFGGEENRKFMTKRFKNLLLEIHEKSMPEQKQILEDTMRDWMGEKYAQIDDIWVIGFRL